MKLAKGFLPKGFTILCKKPLKKSTFTASSGMMMSHKADKKMDQFVPQWVFRETLDHANDLSDLRI